MRKSPWGIGLLVVGVLSISCGGSSSTPAAPTTTTTPATSPTTSTTFSGTVTNIVTGTSVSGATVTIGTTSATTGTDGTYSLEVTASGQPDFSVSATGYYTRKSGVSMTGSTTINPEIIPQGDGFDLAFFDHSFREGSKGTTRWADQAQAPYEIWMQVWKCVEPCVEHGAEFEATAETIPGNVETYMREAIAHTSDLTGGTMTNPVITTKTHPVGTRVGGGGSNRDGASGNSIQFIFIDKFENPAQGGSAWLSFAQRCSDPCAGLAITGSTIKISRAHDTHSRGNGIYTHELGHALGMIPGHGADLSLVPGPSIMGDDAVGVTAKDRLHTKILYKRPIGSVSPDTDPAGTTIN